MIKERSGQLFESAENLGLTKRRKLTRTCRLAFLVWRETLAL
ncbi:hypothetical protein BXY66_3983 [Shimia isoporae]|uniref:Uncharacterized protein n=1 Tax=Shimia isoporae TaxID=647720 RepID=A0A4R1N849_9RHOB|nr:hypothetical protein BXY66_3983 [Shimia isoporae]